MKLPDAEKMFALLKSDEARRYFHVHRRIFLGPRTTSVQAVDIKIVKKARRKDVKNFVAIFTVQTKRQTMRVVGLANSDGSREQEHLVTKALFRSAQYRTHLAVPKPYYYDRERGISFIAYIDGRHLTNIVAEKNDIPRTLLHELMRCIEDLQTIPIKRLVPDIAEQADLKPAEKDLRLLVRRAPTRVRKLSARWKAWRRWWGKEHATFPRVLAHGDYHPKNIFILPASRKKRVCLIDFGRTHLAPRLWDLAEFLSQLETHPALHLPRGRIVPLQKKALAAREQIIGPLSAKDREDLSWFKKYFDLSSLAYLLAWENNPGLRKHIHWLYRRL